MELRSQRSVHSGNPKHLNFTPPFPSPITDPGLGVISQSALASALIQQDFAKQLIKSDAKENLVFRNSVAKLLIPSLEDLSVIFGELVPRIGVKAYDYNI